MHQILHTRLHFSQHHGGSQRILAHRRTLLDLPWIPMRLFPRPIRLLSSPVLNNELVRQPPMFRLQPASLGLGYLNRGTHQHRYYSNNFQIIQNQPPHGHPLYTALTPYSPCYKIYMGAYVSPKLTDPTSVSRLLLPIITLSLLHTRTACQSEITLYPSPQAKDPTPVQMFSQASGFNSSFTQLAGEFDCSLSPLYTYRQTSAEYLNTSSTYQILLTNLSQQTHISLSTKYGNFAPLALTSTTCQPGNCTLVLANNCPQTLTHGNYFDILLLNISGLTPAFQYYIYCDTSFSGASIEYGLLIMIVFAAVTITVGSVYSYAWSLGGTGLQLNIYIVCGFNVLLVIGGLVIYFGHQDVVNVTVTVLSWVCGLASVWLCSNEILFLLHRAFKYQVYTFKAVRKPAGLVVRVMDVISLGVSLGVCFGWWFSGKNWVINDVISIAIIIAAMKFLKFVSLKQAVTCFGITITVQLVYVVICYVKQIPYNTFILNTFNYPFQLQIPTVNPQYNQKCAWLPVTAIIYPGALMSYMRRFDTTRSTNVYIITCLCLFLAGSLLWMFMSIWTGEAWPYGLIAEPATLLLISFFAWKRKEIKIIWWGKFIDEEFVHRDYLKAISENLEIKRRDTAMFKAEMFEGLRAKEDDSEYEPSQRPRGRSIIQPKLQIEESQLNSSGLTTVKQQASLVNQSLGSKERKSKQIQLASITQSQINIKDSKSQSRFPEAFINSSGI